MKFLPTEADTPRVNLTPLIDVVFLLLIFLMVSTSFVDSGSLNIELPQASTKPQTEQFDLMVTVTRDGHYLIDSDSVAKEQLYPKLEAIALTALSNGRQPNELSAQVHADGAAPHATVVKAMDALSRAGFSTVGIATLYNGQ